MEDSCPTFTPERKEFFYTRIDEFGSFLERFYGFENVDIARDLELQEGVDYAVLKVIPERSIICDDWKLNKGQCLSPETGPLSSKLLLASLLNGFCNDNAIPPGDYCIQVW